MNTCILSCVNRNSGYNKGHLVAARNHRCNTSLNCTFSMANIIPQIGNSFNNGLWSNVESFVFDLLKNCFYELAIVTGPIFSPRIKKNGCTIQYKSFLAENRTYEKNELDLSSYLTTIETIESKAGISMFPNITRGKINQ
ncbi:hypothetical protein MXB_3754, partial [Myxobolus squamalis]